MHVTARFSTDEMRIYSAGYYYSVVMALRVGDLAVENFERRAHERRVANRKKRSA